MEQRIMLIIEKQSREIERLRSELAEHRNEETNTLQQELAKLRISISRIEERFERLEERLTVAVSFITRSSLDKLRTHSISVDRARHRKWNLQDTVQYSLMLKHTELLHHWPLTGRRVAFIPNTVTEERSVDGRRFTDGDVEGVHDLMLRLSCYPQAPNVEAHILDYDAQLKEQTQSQNTGAMLNEKLSLLPNQFLISKKLPGSEGYDPCWTILG